MLLDQCICGSRRRSEPYRAINDVMVVTCLDCHAVRQALNMTPDELTEWYQEYFKGRYTHTYEHDRAVAKLRIDRYGLSTGCTLLDVGSGNGAFIDVARERGIDAWGQDLSPDSESDRVYIGQLEAIAFPTDSYDVVTLHDVLEHVVDPLATLKEVRRILKRPGKLVLDFPNFFDEEGRHHWKHVEHLWMLDIRDLHHLLERAGFKVTDRYAPIPSKIVIEAEPIAERRPQILTPAGIGDSWWVLTKLPGFLKAHGLGAPDVWVQDSGGPKRTHPFLRTVPFINAAGYRVLPDRDPTFHEAYMQNARTVFPNVHGVDYFIAYNGVMRAGRSLEDVDPEYGCDWRTPMFISKEALDYRDRFQAATQGKYIVTYYAEAGMYRSWLRQFPKERIAAALTMLEKHYNAKIIFIGAPWDLGQVGRDIARSNPNWIDLIGATTFDQMLGLLLGATAVVGFPAGNTMLATRFNVPTVLLWNEYFDNRFWRYSCPPDAPYLPLDTLGLQPDMILRAVQSLV